MRITRETLIKLARDSVQSMLQRDRRMVSIYLTGSLLTDEPLIGGTTDIDLIFVHDNEPLVDREIVRMSDEVHLDIAHFSQSMFHQPRHLRVDPWIGPFLCETPMVLHDSHHWFEFTQAAVCAQFHQPEYAFQRAHAHADQARKTWMDLHFGSIPDGPGKVLSYLDAMEKAANAVASFSGPPLTERRLFLQMPARAEAIGRPGLAAGLNDLLLPVSVDAHVFQSWLPAWNAALDQAGKDSNHIPRLDLNRKNYYTRAAGALAATSEQMPAAVWIALRTWTLALNELENQSPNLDAWRDALDAVELEGDHFAKRMEQFDAYLDNVEDALDEWAREYGIETNI